QMHAGLKLALLKDAIAKAEHIVLHAAIYSNFAHNEIGAKLRLTLKDNSLKQLTIISLEPDGAWHREFAAVLRPTMSLPEVERLYQDSRNWCAELKQQFPEQVTLVSTHALAFQPILLIGDRIFAGHYAHSELTCADGIWLELDLVQLGFAAGSLTHWVQTGEAPLKANPWAAALGRYVAECHQAAGLGRAEVNQAKINLAKVNLAKVNPARIHQAKVGQPTMEPPHARP
ncbi:MAG: hypothetical protein ACRDA8_05930, partial [Shewanella sp.]